MPAYYATQLPNKITGCVLWWDFNDMATINTGGVLSDGTAVTTAKDKVSGVSITGTATFKTAVQNGKNALLFNGTSNYLHARDISQLGGHVTRTSFLVFKNLNVTNFRGLWYGQIRDGVTDWAGHWWYNYFSGADYQYVETDVADTVHYRHQTGSSDTSNFHLFSARMNGSSAIKNSQFDLSSSKYQSTGNIALDITASNDMTLAASWRTLTNVVDNNWANCYICEVIYFNTYLSDKDYAAVTRYLKTKWGL